MLSKALDMSKRTITDIFFWSTLLSNISVKWSSAGSVEWSFLFPLCRWCMTLLESRKLVNCEWAALSHTLNKIGSRDIGLVFVGSSLFPDLRIGTVSAFFHGSVRELRVRNCWYDYNHGQKSWDTWAFSNSHKSNPSPHPTNNVGRLYPKFFRVSTLYRVGGGRSES